jgi:hypothetical protein
MVKDFCICPNLIIFVQKFIVMEASKKNRAIWWAVFFVSTAALLWAIDAHWEWLTLILPFQTTSFVKAMDIM